MSPPPFSTAECRADFIEIQRATNSLTNPNCMMNNNADNTVSTATVPNPAPLTAVSHIGKREKRCSALSFFFLTRQVK